MTAVTIRPMMATDAEAVLAIYAAGIAAGDADVRDRAARLGRLRRHPAARAPAGRHRPGHRCWRDVLLLERRSPIVG